MMTELLAIYDSRKSFYKKAMVREYAGGLELYSYNTLVAEIKDGKPILYGQYSQTTTRHQKEFLLQNGFSYKDNKTMFAECLEK